MATLTSTKIKNTYDALLKASDNDAIGSSAKQITDGLGNGTPLYISTTQIGIGVTPEATYDLHVYSNAKVGGNLTVTGDLTVEGTTTTIDTQTLTVEDPLIEVASNNTSTDAVDIGWYGKYAPSGTVLYAGLFRDTGDSKFKLFRNLEEQPTTTVNTSGTGYTKADLVIGDLDALDIDAENITLPTTGTNSGIPSSVGVAYFGNTNNRIFNDSSGITLRIQASDNLDIKAENFSFSNTNGSLLRGGDSGVRLYYQNSEKLTTTTNGIEVTGTGSFTGQVTIPATPVADTDAASKGYVDGLVEGQDTLAEILANGNTTGGTDLIVSTSDQIFLPNGSLSNPALSFTNDTDTGISYDASSGIRFSLGASERFRISNNFINFKPDGFTRFSVNYNGIFAYLDTEIQGELTVTGTGQSSFAGQVTIPATPVASTDAASKGYVDSQVGANNELSEVLANGNTTGGTDIAITAGDKITNFTSTGIDDNATSTSLTIASDGVATFINNIDINGNNKHIRFIDTYGNWLIEAGDGANNFKIHSQSLAADYLTLEGGGQLNLGEYGSGSFTGTAAYNLSVDSSGNIIETAGGVVDGSGTATFLPRWLDSNTLGDSILNQSSNDIIIGYNSNSTHSFEKTFATGHATGNRGAEVHFGMDDGGGNVGMRVIDSASSNASFNAQHIEFHTHEGGVSVGKRMEILSTGNSIFYNNVGIGTTSPSTKLHLGGTAPLDSIIRQDSTVSGTNWEIGERAAGKWQIWEDDGDSVVATFMSSGNVGIGTDSPDAIFHVAKANSGGIGGQIVIDNPTSSTLGNSVEISFLTDAGASGTNIRNARILAVNENAGNGAANMQFHTWNGSTSAERMRIDSTGNTTINGDTSINRGNQTSGELLLGGTTDGGFVDFDGTSLQLNTQRDPNTGTFVNTGKSNASINLVGAAGGSYIRFNTAAANNTTATERMRINSVGDMIIKDYGNIYASINNSTVNSGIYFGGTDNTLRSYTNDTERMRIDSSGNVGIGETSPTSKLHVKDTPAATSGAILTLRNSQATASNTTFGGIFFSSTPGYDFSIGKSNVNSTTTLSFRNGNSGASLMDIDAAGNVGIGTTSPDEKLDVVGKMKISDDIILAQTNGRIDYDNGNSNGALRFHSTSANEERMRITSGGHVLFGTTDTALSSGVGFKYIDSATAPYFGLTVNSSSATGVSNFHHYNTNATYNGFRFYITNNGGIYNYSANNVNLSDERVKTNIELSGNYLDKICSIPVRLFNYKDEPEGTEKNLGVIAQEVEAIAPELVNPEGFGETPEDGIPLKSVYTTDMMYALMKAIQELKADNDSLRARIETLENN